MDTFWNQWLKLNHPFTTYVFPVSRNSHGQRRPQQFPIFPASAKRTRRLAASAPTPSPWPSAAPPRGLARGTRGSLIGRGATRPLTPFECDLVGAIYQGCRATASSDDHLFLQFASSRHLSLVAQTCRWRLSSTPGEATTRTIAEHTRRTMVSCCGAFRMCSSGLGTWGLLPLAGLPYTFESSIRDLLRVVGKRRGLMSRQ